MRLIYTACISEAVVRLHSSSEPEWNWLSAVMFSKHVKISPCTEQTISRMQGRGGHFLTCSATWRQRNRNGHTHASAHWNKRMLSWVCVYGCVFLLCLPERTVNDDWEVFIAYSLTVTLNLTLCSQSYYLERDYWTWWIMCQLFRWNEPLYV